MKLIKKHPITIASLSTLLLIVGAWFFFFRWTDKEAIIEPVIEEPEIQESADDIRIRHLNLIKKFIPAAIARGTKLPLPVNGVTIDFDGNTLMYQGEISPEFFAQLWLNVLVDPVKNTSYEYALSDDGEKYQIFTTLDDSLFGNLPKGSTTYAVGETEGLLFYLDGEGDIIHRDQTGTEKIDIADATTRKKIWLEPIRSCKEILYYKNLVTTAKSWVYTIDIDGRETKVYCDMQTDGGGWTLFYANNGYTDSPIAKSYVQMRDTMKTEPLLDFSNYDDKYLAGLLDYSHFIHNGDTEILIRNRSGDQKKWVKFTFSSTRALDWALWPLVLWKTEYGCIDLPRRDTWSIINDNQKIVHTDLRQIMNHGGTSWGVSHEKYLCNGLEKWANSHIGFYSAFDPKTENRARSGEGIGGKWGEGNEYRYFIR